ncbi:MAG: hypothetical protein QXF92_03740 [Thermosphaera sp.]
MGEHSTTNHPEEKKQISLKNAEEAGEATEKLVMQAVLEAKQELAERLRLLEGKCLQLESELQALAEHAARVAKTWAS